jgi:DNA-binding transcriptional regulator LsrR (DeoR family)
MRTQPDEISVRKMNLAAEMYYLYDMSQKEIADRLSVSRPWVSKLLKRAKETGVVRIEINSPLAGNPDIESRIREKYHINNITVIKPLVEHDYTNISVAAASYLISHVKNTDVIGVSWGMSIAHMIEHVVDMNLPGVNIVPIVGGAGSDAECLSNTNVTNLSGALGAECMLLHANACCSDMEERRILMSNQRVKEIIDLGEKADIALLGIGDLENSRILSGQYVSDTDLQQIRDQEVVGDIAFRFLTKDGEIADIDFNKRVIGCDLKKISRNAREVIAIAYGTEKAEVIKAALKSGLITTLFTDLDTAELL